MGKRVHSMTVGDDEIKHLTRRQALLRAATVLTGTACSISVHLPEAPCNALGERVGEVTPHSAIIHTRLTAQSDRNNRGYSFPFWTHSLSREQRLTVRVPEGMTVADLEGACPGKEGLVRLHHSRDPGVGNAKASDWVKAGFETDFTHQFQLEGLNPETRYYYAVEMKALSDNEIRRGAIGSFRTAPLPERWTRVKFTAVTCQDYACRDHVGGYKTYESMTKLAPDFLLSTGDSVYYDIDLPLATSVELARFHWHRMYSQPSLVNFFRTASGYWLKDDHDTFEDDDWPTRQPQRVAPMTWADLAPVFLEQVPMGPKPYRSLRWGRGIEIWLVDTREFRSPNPDPDGPNKTIWGAEQKAWLKKTLLASDAQFRVLVSPDCIVGPGGEPDRVHFKMPEGGADSQGDGGFAYEGREFRRWVRENELTNLLVINGDRHWQYHSVDPESGLHEFSCGPVADAHASDHPFDPKYHRFLRHKGGFIAVSLEGTEQRPQLVVEHRDVEGTGVHQFVFTRAS